MVVVGGLTRHPKTQGTIALIRMPYWMLRKMMCATVQIALRVKGRRAVLISPAARLGVCIASGGSTGVMLWATSLP